MTQVGDPIITPVTDTTVDGDGNTTVVGYPSGTNESYSGTPDTDPNGPGLGVGAPSDVSEGA